MPEADFRRRLLPAVLVGLLAVAAPLAGPEAVAGQRGDAVDAGRRGDDPVRARLRERADALRARHLAATLPPAAPALPSPSAAAPLSKLQAGELVSASERRGRALRIVLNDDRARVKRTPLDESFVPRGVDFDSERRLLAVAAVSRVLLYQVDDNEVTVIEPEDGFGFANDVLFDGDVLVIADMGESIVGQFPRDGVIRVYDLETGEFGEIAARRAFSNPKLLARDSRGRVHIVDGEAGPLITPQLELRYDVLYRVKGARQRLARPIFDDEGLLASAYAIGPDDRHWFGMVDSLAILESPAAELELPCGLAPTFDFVNGFAFASEEEVHLLDGSPAQSTRRTLYTVDDACDTRERVGGVRIAESRGLAMVQETEEDEED